jgi:hypothetical protein
MNNIALITTGRKFIAIDFTARKYLPWSDTLPELQARSWVPISQPRTISEYLRDNKACRVILMFTDKSTLVDDHPELFV